MALLPPIFQQNREYSARVTRQFLDLIGTEGVVDAGDLEVVERQAGAAMSVEVVPGRAFVTGDDQANQGNYLVANEAVLGLPVQAADPDLDRIDRVVLQIRDPNAGGPAGDDVILSVLTGTASATPVAPVTPDSAISLAVVAVDAASISIVQGDITDERTFTSNPLSPPPDPPAFDSLTDVEIDTPLDGDFVRYDTALDLWVNGGVPIGDLSDVDADSPAADDFLVYDTTSGDWMAKQLSSLDLTLGDF